MSYTHFLNGIAKKKLHVHLNQWCSYELAYWIILQNIEMINPAKYHAWFENRFNMLNSKIDTVYIYSTCSFKVFMWLTQHMWVSTCVCVCVFVKCVWVLLENVFTDPSNSLQVAVSELIECCSLFLDPLSCPFFSFSDDEDKLFASWVGWTIWVGPAFWVFH